MSSIAVTASASGAGVITLQAPITATNRTITLPDATGTVATAESTLSQFNATGAAPVYACRAWCNFNGALTGTNAPRAGGNVTSITRNGLGDYMVTFTIPLPDVNYSVTGTTGGTAAASALRTYEDGAARTSSTVRVSTFSTVTGNPADYAQVNLAIFR